MYLKNWWYMAAWSSEVSRVPLRRLILNQPLVLYRRENGQAVALEDRCPHRNYPLSKGTLIGDNVQCGYHGLIIGSDGQCVHAPGQEKPPGTACARSYTLSEKHGVIWAWTGEDPSDFADVPDLGWLEQTGWTSWTGGYIHLKCNHQLLTENLLDISHLAYVHKSTMGSDPERIAQAQTSVTPTEWGLRRRVRMANIPTPPTYRLSSLVKDRIDQWTESEMRPGLYQNHTQVKTSTDGEDWEEASYPIRSRSFHGIVPETETTTHYFHGGGRLDIDVEAMTGDWAHKVLHEDVEVLEAIQENTTYVRERPVLNLRNDMAVMQWRSTMKILMKKRQPETA